MTTPVPPASSASIEPLSRVQAVLLEQFPMLRSLPLEADTALISTGLLDSFALVTLITALDRAFSIDIDVDQVELEAFETPGAIAELCQRTLNGT